jgi:hypothetical protein
LSAPARHSHAPESAKITRIAAAALILLLLQRTGEVSAQEFSCSPAGAAKRVDDGCLVVNVNNESVCQGLRRLGQKVLLAGAVKLLCVSRRETFVLSRAATAQNLRAQ